MHASTRETLRIGCALLVGVLFPICCHAWIHHHHHHHSTSLLSSSSTTRQRLHHQQYRHHQQNKADNHRWSSSSTWSSSQLSVAATSDDSLSTASSDEEDDDEDEEEFEYVEYDILTEPEFMGSEWLVGTVPDGNPNKIQETWVRLAVDKDGKNVAIWGDNSQGTWAFDTANQFLSFSKEQLWGKDIWAGVVQDYYFTQGTVRGWNFLMAAAVKGQWQARRLGVDPDEAGVAPWFEEPEEVEEEEEEDYAVNSAMEDSQESASATSMTSEDATGSNA